jgi:hypothetical protein
MKVSEYETQEEYFPNKITIHLDKGIIRDIVGIPENTVVKVIDTDNGTIDPNDRKRTYTWFPDGNITVERENSND